MKRIGIYIRVSTEEQARIQDGSLVSQRKRLEEYVDGQNRREASWGKIIGVYVDEGKSAKDLNRPEFQRLLEDVRLGKVDLILATELSRLSRSIKDFCGLWDLFKEKGCQFITLREQFDTTTAAGEMMVFNLINFAQFERKQTAERIAANWASRAKRGLWNGGTIPLGFDRNPKNPGALVPNPVEAKQVEMIFETFLEVRSLRQTCLKLSKLGIHSRRFINKAGANRGGGHFTVSTLYGLLTNRSYVGLREVSKKAGSHETVPASWPAIVGQEIFEQTQKLLAANHSKLKPRDAKTYAYPMTEKVICGECGKTLGGKSAQGRSRTHYYYAHSRQLKSDGINHHKRCRLERVQAERLEEIVSRSIQRLLNSSERFDEMIRIYREKTEQDLPGLDGRIKTLDSDLKLAEKRIENLTLRVADLPPDMPADPLYRQMKDLQAKAGELKLTRTTLETEAKQARRKTSTSRG